MKKLAECRTNVGGEYTHSCVGLLLDDIPRCSIKKYGKPLAVLFLRKSESSHTLALPSQRRLQNLRRRLPLPPFLNGMKYHIRRKSVLVDQIGGNHELAVVIICYGGASLLMPCLPRLLRSTWRDPEVCANSKLLVRRKYQHVSCLYVDTGHKIDTLR